MSSILVVGATRGLGAELAKQCAQLGKATKATTRSVATPKGFPDNIAWLPEVDLMKPDVGDRIVGLLNASEPLDTVVRAAQASKPETRIPNNMIQIISAGHFTTEDLSDKGPNWDEELRMYTTSAIAPVFIVQRLFRAGLLQTGSKVVLVSSEAGSIGLRNETEGGGNYAHHASKAALNMVGKLLSLDLKDKGVTVSIIHPGFMRTEMTKGVGFDKYWDSGGGRLPDYRYRDMTSHADIY
jgi:NAD(P)-dependent dehydrogenase (short-subunit alcohol dehydrogenase family)